MADSWISLILSQKVNNTASKKSILKLSPEDQDADQWNDFIEAYLLSCDSTSILENLKLLKDAKYPPFSQSQLNKLKNLAEIFQKNENDLDDPSLDNDCCIKTLDDIKMQTTNKKSKWRREPHYDFVLGHNNFTNNIQKNEESCPGWLFDVEEEIVHLDWQKFKK